MSTLLVLNFGINQPFLINYTYWILGVEVTCLFIFNQGEAYRILYKKNIARSASNKILFTENHFNNVVSFQNYFYKTNLKTT